VDAPDLPFAAQGTAQPGVPSPGSQARYLLGERLVPAARVVAEQAPDPQPDHHPPIAASASRRTYRLCSRRDVPAPRTGSLVSSCACPDAQVPSGQFGMLDDHFGQMRQQPFLARSPLT